MEPEKKLIYSAPSLGHMTQECLIFQHSQQFLLTSELFEISLNQSTFLFDQST